MWYSQGSVLRFSQCLRVESLCDFSHSLRLPDLLLRRFFCREFAWFFVERLRDLLYKELAWFFVWRGCVTFCVKRFSSKKKFSGENSFLVKLFFCWNLVWQIFFVVKFFLVKYFFGEKSFFLGKKSFFGHFICSKIQYDNCCEIHDEQIYLDTVSKICIMIQYANIQ